MSQQEKTKLLNQTKEDTSVASSNAGGGTVLPKVSAHSGSEEGKRSCWQIYKWMILIGVIVVITAIILACTLGGSDEPPVPPTPPPTPPGPPPIPAGYNPYHVDKAAIKNEQSTVSGYILADQSEILRQQDRHPLNANKKDNITASDNHELVSQGINNNVIGNISFEFGQNDFRSAYLRLGNGAEGRFSVPSEAVNKPGAQQNLKLDQVGFSLIEEHFGFEFMNQRTQKPYLTTRNQAFVMMDRYLQLDLVLPSRQIYGFGERNANFTLQEGTWTMWAQDPPRVSQVDDGTKGRMGTQGVHPFALVQTETKGEFMGLYFRNSNLMTPVIQHVNETATRLSLISIGGDLEVYFFFKGTAKQIIAQYQTLVGKPALPPVWALGWQFSSQWDNATDLDSWYSQYNSSNLPVEVIAMNEQFQDVQRQFKLLKNFENITSWITQKKAENGLKFVGGLSGSIESSDFTNEYFSTFLQKNALIKSTHNPKEDQGVLGQYNDNGPIVFPDFFSNETKPIWMQGMEALLNQVPFDGFTLVDNAGPSGYCVGECPNPPSMMMTEQSKPASEQADINDQGWWWGFYDQDSNSTWTLPFVPGFIFDKFQNDISLDYHTASLNGTHPSNNLTEYDLHNLYSHVEGKMTHEILKESQQSHLKDKLPFLRSDGSFSGSGQFMGHSIKTSFDTESGCDNFMNLRYLVSGIMNFNMYGMPLTGTLNTQLTPYTEKVQEDSTARYFQLSAFSPLALYNDLWSLDSADNALSNFNAFAKNQIVKAMYERLSFTHLFYTCLFEAHDSGKTCYDPLQFHFPDNAMVAGLLPEDSIVVADSIMVSIEYNQPSSSKFNVTYPNIKNGAFVNLRNFAVTHITKDEGEVKEVASDNVDAQLMPGKIIPWVDTTSETLKTTTEVYNSHELSLVINRDARGHALGSLYLSDGETQSQLDSKTYEYYQFNLGSKSLKKWNKNENRVPSGKTLSKIIITNGEDLQNTDFACMTNENDHTVTSLKVSYDQMIYALVIEGDGAAIDLYNMKDIHFGKASEDVNLCNIQSHYYIVTGDIMKTTNEWTINMVSKTATIAKNAQLKLRMFKESTINLEWAIQGADESQLFRVPDAALNFNRSATIPFDESLIEMTVVNDATRIIIKNKDGVNLYALNGFVMTDDHFNYFDVDIMTDGKLMGLADQISDSLFLEDGVYSLWARDTPSPVADGKLPSKNEYGVQPFVVSTSTTMPSVGLFSNVAAAQDWWIKTDSANKLINIRMYAAGGVGDHFVFVGGSTPGPLPVIKGFMHHFAQPLAVPQWAFGWHQCRWGYNSTTKLREVVDRFAEEELPLDAIWNDIDYMKDYRSFSYDSEGEFADLPQFIQEIHNNSLHYVPIIDAGIAVRQDNPAYLITEMHGQVIKAFNGEDFVGMVWPNDAVWMDWFEPTSDNAWMLLMFDLHRQILFDGIWLDMNEASNFCHGACYYDQQSDAQMQDTLRYIPTGRDLSTQSISLEATHDNGVTELDAHSLFGHMSANVTSEFFTKTNKRPFVIERSAYTGTSRFASRWLGDNFSSEKFMGYSVTGVMAQSFNGYTLTGADVCGFMGNTNPELCARWYSVAAFQPFARNHNSWETMAQEPYQFDKDIYESTITYFDIIKHSMQARLNMIRYMYSSTMLDMVLGNGVYYQPLFFQFPADANAYLDQQNNVMLGKSLKLSVLSNAVGQDTHDFYFPAGTWCSMWQNIGEAACMTSTGQNVTMSSKAYNFYVHIRESSIVPIQNVTFLKDYYPETSFTSTADMQDQPVELHILPNSTDDASGDYYNDDGEVLTDQVGVFNIYQMVLSKNATDNSLVINITMPHTADNETYENSVINSNDVLGQIHLYNAKARGYDANNWQSEFHFRDNTVTELFIAQYEPMVNRVILPPTYVYLPSIDYIVLKPI